MASLLRELLHDAERRSGEIAAGLAAGQGTSSADVDAYRQRMQSLVDQARQLVASMLADPDLDNPLFAASYYRDYKHLARLMQELENIPLLVLRRFSPADEQLTALVGAICREIGFPFRPPICSSISSQFYWTMPDMEWCSCRAWNRIICWDCRTSTTSSGTLCCFANGRGWSIARWRWSISTTMR